MQTAPPKHEIVYPDTDGQPMANNTKQAQAMMVLKENLDLLHRHRNDVFIAIDHFWYPVEGHPEIRQAPDVMVVFGRPKGHRPSYKQWEEGNIPPQVVFEVLSPSNTASEMAEKLAFYERYGVEEYYIYDPETGVWQGYMRSGGRLVPIEGMEGWESPRLGVRFGRGEGDEIGVYDRSGVPFRYLVEVQEALLQKVMEARQQAQQERQRAEQLAQKLRELGVDPDTL